MHKSIGRPRDNKGRFISNSKFPTTFGLVNIPVLTVANRYAGLRQEGGSVDANVVLDRELFDREGRIILKIIFDNPVEELVEQPDLVDKQSTNIYRVPTPQIHTTINKPQWVPIANMENARGEGRHIEEHQEEGEGPRWNVNLLGENHEEEEEEVTFGFPILDVTRNINMKKILMASLPLFYSKLSKDPNAFLFGFDILCHSYNSYDDAH